MTITDEAVRAAHRDANRATERRMTHMGPSPVHAPPVSLNDLPSGPRLPGIVQVVGLLAFRHQFVPALKRRYGDVFRITVLPGDRQMVMFHRPEHVREIFAGDPEVFHAGKGNAILGPVMGEHSLLMVDSGAHKRARKLVMPAFNGHAIRGYRTLVARLAREEVDRWVPGARLSALERMNALTLEVILQVVFGVTAEDRLARLRPLVNRTVTVNPLVFLGWGFRRVHGLPPFRGAIENQRRLDEVIYAEIRERRSAPDLAERTDVLSRLLLVEDEEHGSLSDAELRDQLVTLLLAGHETTATALAWALHELGRDPRVLAEAVAAAQGEAPEDDAHLEAVLKESMRLHPVIPMVVRQLTAPATVGGVALPAGVTVGASILLAHADPRAFPDPERFDPGRFLRAEVETNTWLPFGGGVRRCIGAGFSLMEGVAVLREVLATHDVRAVRADRPKVRNITSVPRHGARIVPTPRPDRPVTR